MADTTIHWKDDSKRNHEILFRFEKDFLEGKSPQIKDYLEGEGVSRSNLLMELLQSDLELRFRADQPIHVLDYLAQFPELASQPDDLTSLVASEVRWLQHAGHKPGLKQYVADYAGVPGVRIREAFERAGAAPPDIPGYEILEEIGRGGMGIVYQARQSNLNRIVAMKVMKTDDALSSAARSRFLREARAAAAISHDHVVPILECGEHRGRPYLIMPLLQGESLESRLSRGPLNIDELGRFGLEAASGLTAVHLAGLVHRDIKPSNFWLETRDLGWRVRLLDFGLARINEGGEDITRAGTVLGTPAYMSPEQAEGKPVDFRSDLFSLGAVLYHAATGVSPFQRDSIAATLRAVADHQPPGISPSTPSLPPKQVAIIEQLLAKDPASRPKNTQVVANVFACCAMPETTVVSTVNEKALQTARLQKVKNGRVLPIGLAMVILFSLMIVVFLVFRKDGAQSNQTTPVNSSLASPAQAPLKVLDLAVQHYARTSPDSAELKGLIGERSFGATLGDQVTISAKLSRPAYAFLIAFRPDGTAEVCWPDSETSPPTKTDILHYPPPGQRNVRYGLTDGVGLMAFVVAASEEPLPPYQQWYAKARPHWVKAEGKLGQVWRDHGDLLDVITPGNQVSVTRGKGEKALGSTSVLERLTDELKSKSQPCFDAIGSLGFVVQGR